MSEPRRCIGTTKSGKQCRQMVYNEEGDPYCFQHEKQRPAAERFSSLRSLLDGEPSIEQWEKIVAALEKWKDGAELPAALDYIEQHMEHWPHRYRTGLGFTPRLAAWPLFRHVHFSMPRIPDMALREAHPQITSFGAFCSGHHELRAFRQDEISAAVTTLQLTMCYVEGAGPLLASMTQLENLQLTAYRFDLRPLRALEALEA